MRKKFSLNINNRTIAATTAGRGMPFIWTHGLLSCRAREEEIELYDLNSLAETTQLIRYDVVGHGDSEASPQAEDYQWTNVAETIYSLAKALEFKQVVAGGLSLGSAASICAAVSHAERIAALVLVCPPTAWETREAQVETYLDLVRLTERGGRRPIVLATRQEPIYPAYIHQARPDARDIAIRYASQLNENALPLILRGAAASNLPDKNIITKISQPTLILAWEGDEAHPLSTARELDELLPNSELHIASTHQEVSDWPKQIGAFLKSLSAKS